MDWMIVAIGLAGGFLVGLTGIGSGAIITPLLIAVAGIPATTAVGSDLVHAAVMKSFGSWKHHQQKTVSPRLVFYLALGSVPGALVGVALIWLARETGHDPDLIVKQMLGWTLVVVAVAMLAGLAVHGRREPQEWASFSPARKSLAVAMGAIVGVFVGFTSIGAGSILLPTLVFLFPIGMARIVGTNVLHGLVLSVVAGAAHGLAGSVDLTVAGNLLAGSIPGVLLGSWLVPRIPNAVMRPAMGVVLLVAGLRLA